MASSPDLRSFDLGLALAGGVSCGAYTAGVVDFVVEALDAWQHARGRADEDAPDHEVRLRVVGGASSGALTAALLGAILPFELEPVRATTEPKVAARNPLFDSWVNMTGFEDLLGDGDAREGRVRSLLDPTPVDRVARKGIEHTLAPCRTPRRWLAEPLRILFSVANLQGVRYSLAPPGLPVDGLHATQHAEVLRFAFTGVGRAGTAPPRRDERVIDHEAGSADAAARWQAWGRDFTTAALASAAVPGALPSRRLSAPWSEHENLALVLPGCRAWPAEIVRIAPIDDGHAGDSHRFDAVDGGLVDNTALDHVRAELNDRDPLACSPREPADCWHAAVLVDPLVDGTSVQATPADASADPPALLGALAKLLIDQARARPADLALARKENVYTRFLVTPGRAQVNEGGGADLAGASLGGFGGYLSRDFRLHDFLLGRRNAQQALAMHLALPATHPLFAAWTDGQRQRYAISGGKELPIIPLVGTLHPVHGRLEDLVAWSSSASIRPRSVRRSTAGCRPCTARSRRWRCGCSAMCRGACCGRRSGARSCASWAPGCAAIACSELVRPACCAINPVDASPRAARDRWVVKAHDVTRHRTADRRGSMIHEEPTMPVHSRTFAPVRWRVRLAAAAAAVTASASLLSALLLAFDRAGPQTWLAPSAEVLEMAADCDRHTERSVRDHCKRQLVDVRVARDRRGPQLAGP